MRGIVSSLVVVLLGAALPIRAADPPRIDFLRLPEGVYQPQALVDEEGVVHLVVLEGDPGSANVVYHRLPAGSAALGRGVRVNSQPGSAIAIGSIRGAQMALGRDGRVHVVWNGSERAEPRNPLGGTPLLYARSDPQGLRFEPQRNRMARTSVLDGGGSVAADRSGRVFVVWHGAAEDAEPGEASRKLYVARSDDDGRTFAPEQPAFDEPAGVCACCGVKAWADDRGELAVLFRAARTTFDRDLILAETTGRESGFSLHPISPWHIKTCPMSRAAVWESPAGPLAAWETDDRVRWGPITVREGRAAEAVAAPGDAKQRHPALAANRAGQVLLVWTEGTAWQKGGDLVWQLYETDRTAASPAGRISGGVPVWGIPAVVARADGSFLVIH